MSVFFINPFAFAAADGDFESIATVTVGSGGASSIEFTSIPGTYQHLQVRFMARSSRSGSATDGLYLEYNSDTSSANYVRFHTLGGNGASASASAQASGVAAHNLGPNLTASSATANIFAAGVADILDYAVTTKNTTVRWFGGQDQNGSGNCELYSGLWLSTAAVTKLKFTVGIGNFVQHSTFALYGIKAP